MAARILVVDDEAAIADTIVYALQSDGFLPHWSPTGKDALAALADFEPDLIVLDVGLPDINGIELFRRISERSSAPVIFLTARAGEIDRIVGLEMGADDYIAKPFSPRELTARIRVVLRRLERGSPAAPTVAAEHELPLTIDADKQRAYYFGSPLSLTRYEFRLLSLLVQRPGRVFSRDELLARAWETPEASYDRTVDAHIKTLRAKLKAIRPEVDPIETHRGSGYALKDRW